MPRPPRHAPPPAIANVRQIANALTDYKTVRLPQMDIDVPATIRSRKRRKSYYRQVRNTVIALQRIKEHEETLQEAQQVEDLIATMQEKHAKRSEEAKIEDDSIATTSPSTEGNE